MRGEEKCSFGFRGEKNEGVGVHTDNSLQEKNQSLRLQRFPSFFSSPSRDAKNSNDVELSAKLFLKYLPNSVSLKADPVYITQRLSYVVYVNVIKKKETTLCK